MIIGRCSNCNGPVSVPANWMGTEPPRPTCTSCGAVKDDNDLPVIHMRPKRPSYYGGQSLQEFVDKRLTLRKPPPPAKAEP